MIIMADNDNDHGETATKVAQIGENQLGPPLRINGTKCRLYGVGGSLITDFAGDAMVNAANEGCVTGFGIDEAINKAGGFELLQSRKQLGGCPTGQAKITPSFGLGDRAKYIVHAVGPVYRRNKHKIFTCGNYDDDDRVKDWAEKDNLLASAYWTALQLASDVNCQTVGFCLLSAGVFRGERSLEDVIQLAVDYLSTAPLPAMKGIESVFLFAYTPEERSALERIMWQKQEEQK